jgi:ABC-type bacteriocin/lantibiotic exporter with double-glycine peptidase domain
MRQLAVARVVAIVAIVATSACVSYSTYVGTAKPFAPEQLEREPGWVAVRTVPLTRQVSQVDCGAAAIAMVVSFWTTAPSAQLAAALRPVHPPGLEAGRLRDFARQHRLRAYLVSGTIADIERELAAGRPIVVGLYKPQRKGSLTHYEVVVGFHRQTGTVVTLDPAAGWRQNNLANFLEEWKHSSYLALVVVGREAAGVAAVRE